MEGIYEQLIQGGAMGLFAAFLIWQHINMQKRMDSLVDRFQQQLDAINKDYDDRIEKMRERYDAVIRDARQEATDQMRDWNSTRAHITEQVVSKLDQNAMKLDSLIQKLDR